MSSAGDLLAQLNARVFERGWLSANGILFRDAPDRFSLVDTGAAAHTAQTLALVAAGVGEGRLSRIINTHLHSDHCGGNAVLQSRWHCEVFVPAASADDVAHWKSNGMSFSYTGQACDRFQATDSISPGQTLKLGQNDWLAVAAPGHDHKALMFFEAKRGVLLAGDALWEERLAVIFPELAMEAGFAATAATLDCIESLAPALVVPGHGAPFSGVRQAIRASRDRLRRFTEAPRAHALYSARSLLMFHLLQTREEAESQLLGHISATEVFRDIARLTGGGTSALAEDILQRLIQDGLVTRQNGIVYCR